MQTIRYIISNDQLEQLKEVANHKKMTLGEVYKDMASSYLARYSRTKKTHEEGPDSKTLKRLHKKGKAAYRQELKDRAKDSTRNTNNIIPLT